MFYFISYRVQQAYSKVLSHLSGSKLIHSSFVIKKAIETQLAVVFRKKDK